MQSSPFSMSAAQLKIGIYWVAKQLAVVMLLRLLIRQYLILASLEPKPVHVNANCMRLGSEL
jgi:hypothetical protein